MTTLAWRRPALTALTLATTTLLLLVSCQRLSEERDGERDPARPADEEISASEPQIRRQAQELGPGLLIEQALDVGEIHEYVARLLSRHALQVTVEQQGVDLALDLLDPAGHPVLAIDSPIEDQGPELLCFPAETAGAYLIRVRPFKPAASGRYVLRVDRLGPAEPRDHRCLEATRAFQRGQNLRQEKGDDRREALRHYETARARWRESDHTFQEAIALKAACGLLADLSELGRAARCYDEALALMRAAGDRRQEIVLLNLLGLARRRLGKLSQAHSAFSAALELARETSNRKSDASALNNLALLEKSRGEHHRAIDYYRQALTIWRSLSRRNSEATTLHNLGVTYSELGRYPEALDLLAQALEIRREAPERARASTLMAIGWTHHLAGDAETAVACLRQAVDLTREAGDRFGEAAALDRLGSALREMGQLAEAREVYQASLRLSKELGNRSGLAHTTANLGWLLQTQGRPEEAKTRLERARDLLRELDDANGLSHVFVGLGQAERSLGDLAAARARFEEALAVVNSLRLSARSLGRHVHPVALRQDYYELYVDLLMEIDRAGLASDAEATAFEASDSRRARNLYEMLVESRLDLRSGVDETLLQAERDLQERLNATADEQRRLIDDQALAEQIAALDRDLRELRLEFQDVQAEIRVRHPRFAEIRDPQRFRLQEVQALLDPGTQILSYVLGKQRSFAFRVTANALHSYELPSREEIEILADTAYRSLRSSQMRRARGQVWSALRDLSAVLLQPLAESPDADRLLVVGEGLLLYVPFAVLPLPEPDPSPGAAPLLIDRYEIVHLPSTASLLALLKRSRERDPAPRRLAVVADPVFSVDDERLQASAHRGAHETARDAGATASGKRYDRLVHASREAEAILRHVSPEESLAALGFDANFDLVSGDVLRDYRTLHFATHAVIDEQHPELSGLVLSRFDEHGRPREDSHLRLHELYGLHLPADLVVLSACRTALGKQLRGDGLVGLTRGFFYAGASRLVVSLWDVEDEATADLMSRFYRGIFADDLTPAAALRQAQLELRRQPERHAPFYWAGFVLQGDWH